MGALKALKRYEWVTAKSEVFASNKTNLTKLSSSDLKVGRREQRLGQKCWGKWITSWREVGGVLSWQYLVSAGAILFDIFDLACPCTGRTSQLPLTNKLFSVLSLTWDYVFVPSLIFQGWTQLGSNECFCLFFWLTFCLDCRVVSISIREERRNRIEMKQKSLTK